MRPVGTRVSLRVYWRNKTGCTDHCGARVIAESAIPDDPQLEAMIGVERADADWPTACDQCGEIAPPIVMIPCPCGCGAQVHADESAHRTGSASPTYAETGGLPRTLGDAGVGDMYYADWYHRAGEPCIHGWTNCDGRHLIVMIPDGIRTTGKPGVHPWDVDGRASNCTMPSDTLHRCWVRHGDPEIGAVHVDKACPGVTSSTTCNAGAGSISTDQFHGFLHNGIVAKC